MNRSKTPKEEDLEVTLLGKSIVDPNGIIIGTCVGVIEDEKKKAQMKVSIKTELNSEFIVEETIPVNLINKIGEIILLKRPFNIQPVVVEDIITFELPNTSIKESESVIESQETKLVDRDNELILDEETTTNEINSKQNNKEIESIEPNETKKRLKYETLFQNIINEKNPTNKTQMIKNCIEDFQNIPSFRKDIQKNFFKTISTTDHNIRYITAEIFEKLCHTVELKDLLPLFFEGLKACYNEPSFDIEEKLIEEMHFIATKLGDELKKLNFMTYFANILLDHKICKNISLNKIHNINMKIFVNNFYIQDILISTYLKPIIEESANAEDYALFLKEFNATIISFTLITRYGPDFWNTLKEKKIIIQTLDDSFMNSINNIHNIFNQKNIKKLAEIIDSKIGSDFSNDLITIMVKNSIVEVLSNLSFLPLDTLCEYYSDPNNRIIQIIFDLINNSEINVEIVFVHDKTYISLYE
ncbi:MAG: hypothetical protein ACFFDW_09420 [Candidatus Thorarchaeota archaeon]